MAKGGSDREHPHPFITEFSVGNLETQLTSVGQMTRFWKRQADDICGITGKEEVETTLNFFNRLHSKKSDLETYSKHTDSIDQQMKENTSSTNLHQVGPS